jgi:hypothetical protein
MADDHAADDDDDTDDGDDFDLAANQLAPPLAAILADADRVFLLRLDPFRRPAAGRPGRAFHTWRVTRRVRVVAAADRAGVAAAVARGLAASDGTFAMCFDPTIGVSAHRGADRVDLVCCFDCNWIRVFAEVGGQPQRARLLTAGSPAPILSALLRRPPGGGEPGAAPDPAA